jgi:hypothetical protein
LADAYATLILCGWSKPDIDRLTLKQFNLFSERAVLAVRRFQASQGEIIRVGTASLLSKEGQQAYKRLNQEIQRG